MNLKENFEKLLSELCTFRDVDGPINDIQFLKLANEYTTLATKTVSHRMIAAEHLIDETTNPSIPCVCETLVYLFYLLKWEEIKNHCEVKREEAEGIPHKSYWAYLLEPFVDDWEDLDLYDPEHR